MTSVPPAPPGRLRVLVVDDEEHARADIVELFEERTDTHVVAVCAGGADAVAAVARHRPDLLLLDIRMPGIDGFGVVSRLDPQRMPYVVFVTAYDRFAIEAFRVNALDYLLKPVQPARLDEALARTRERLRTRSVVDWAMAVRDVARQHAGAATPGKDDTPCWSEIIVPTPSRDLILKVEEIDWVEADTYYVRLHVGGRAWLLRERMHVLQERLDPRRFARVHRSAIVNLERVRAVEHDRDGSHIIVLANGTRVPTSRRRWTEVRALLREPATRRSSG